MYDKFKNRMIKLMKIKNFILKHIVIFITSFIFLAVVTIATLVNVGSIIDYSKDKIVVEYGEDIKIHSSIFLGRAQYQYREVGEEKWRKNLPSEIGEYEIQIIGQKLFDKNSYSDIINLEIKQKNVDFIINDNEAIYGQEMNLQLDLKEGDYLSDVAYDYDVEDGYVYVAPYRESIVILNERGNNVTRFYNFNIEQKVLKIVKRKLTIETESIYKIYDGTYYNNKSYTITEGSLALNDNISTVFKYDSVKDVIDAKNEAKFTIYNDYGSDITSFYDLKVIAGTLFIDTKDVYIQTNEKIKLEDGKPLFENGFNSNGLIDDDHLEVVSNTINKSVGTIPNKLDFIVLDEKNKDITKNYNFIFDYGNLTIVPSVTIKTSSKSKEYDGTNLFDEKYEIDVEIPHNHTFKVKSNTKIKDYGSILNKLEFDVFDENNQNVTKYYDFYYQYGILSIEKRDITLKTNNDRKMYDGKKLTDITFITERLLSQHEIVLSKINNDYLDVGVYENSFEFYIYDEFNNDVSDNYNVKTVWNTKEIYKRPITINTGSLLHVYDESYVTKESFSVKENGLVLDHKVNIVEDFLSFKNIGHYDNIIDVTIVDGKNRDVSKNYDIKYKYGDIHIKERPLNIFTTSKQKFYDKQDLYLPGFSVKEPSGLLNGHRFIQTGNFKTFNKPGEYYNDFEYIVLDDDDNDVTNLYEVNSWGIIKISLFRIDIATESSKKQYDGTPLTNPNYTINDLDNSNEKIKVNVIGTITNVGKVSNDAIIQILDKNNNDITEYFEINKLFGTLEVTKRNDGQLNDGTGNIDNSGEIAHQSNNIDSINNTPAFKFTSDCKDKIYFRAFSFGDYKYNKWDRAPIYNSNDDLSPLYYASKSLENYYENKNINIKLSENLGYLLPYYTINGPLFNNDVNNDLKGISEYNLDFCPYVFDHNDNMHIGEEYRLEEEKYYNWVLENYLTLPNDTREVMLSVASKLGVNASNPNIIFDIQNLIRNTSVLNPNFKDFPTNADMAVHFLTKAREGNSQHFATAAVCMYRAFGIPARYTVGFVSDPNPNREVTVTWKNVHAWVEVYIKGMGWISTEVSGRVVDTGGTDSILKPEIKDQIIIKPIDDAKQYDGTPLYPSKEVDINSSIQLESLLDRGYRYKVKISGSQTEIGSSITNIEEFILYDNYGNDVTSKFDIIKLPGKLTVTDKIAEFRIKSYSKYYDGKGFKYTEDDINVILPEGYTATYKLGGELNKIGISYAYLDDIIIYDSIGNDVTKEFYIKITGGILKIKKIPIEITIASDIKVYDGTPLSNSNFHLSRGELLNGHHIEIENDVRITEVGTMKNIPSSLKIIDEFGNNVKYAYDIQVKEGILEVVAA